MSISGDRKRRIARKTALAYLGIAAFCALFGAVYENYSHGVTSPYMVWMFLIPLVGGALPFGALLLPRRPRVPARAAANLYHSGIATLTVGSCLRGALDIYGTTSDRLIAYPVAGFALIFIAATSPLFRLTIARGGHRITGNSQTENSTMDN